KGGKGAVRIEGGLAVLARRTAILARILFGPLVAPLLLAPLAIGRLAGLRTLLALGTARTAMARPLAAASLPALGIALAARPAVVPAPAGKPDLVEFRLGLGRFGGCFTGIRHLGRNAFGGGLDRHV